MEALTARAPEPEDRSGGRKLRLSNLARKDSGGSGSSSLRTQLEGEEPDYAAAPIRAVDFRAFDVPHLLELHATMVGEEQVEVAAIEDAYASLRSLVQIFLDGHRANVLDEAISPGEPLETRAKAKIRRLVRARLTDQVQKDRLKRRIAVLTEQLAELQAAAELQATGTIVPDRGTMRGREELRKSPGRELRGRAVAGTELRSTLLEGVGRIGTLLLASRHELSPELHAAINAAGDEPASPLAALDASALAWIHELGSLDELSLAAKFQRDSASGEWQLVTDGKLVLQHRRLSGAVQVTAFATRLLPEVLVWPSLTPELDLSALLVIALNVVDQVALLRALTRWLGQLLLPGSAGQALVRDHAAALRTRVITVVSQWVSLNAEGFVMRPALLRALLDFAGVVESVDEDLVAPLFAAVRDRLLPVTVVQRAVLRPVADRARTDEFLAYEPRVLALGLTVLELRMRGALRALDLAAHALRALCNDESPTNAQAEAAAAVSASEPDDCAPVARCLTAVRSSTAVVKYLSQQLQLSQWVATLVCSAETVTERVRVISHMAAVARELMLVPNRASLAALTGGLETTVVKRLERTWAKVDKRTRRTVARLLELAGQGAPDSASPVASPSFTLHASEAGNLSRSSSFGLSNISDDLDMLEYCARRGPPLRPGCVLDVDATQAIGAHVQRLMAQWAHGANSVSAYVSELRKDAPILAFLANPTLLSKRELFHLSLHIEPK